MQARPLTREDLLTGSMISSIAFLYPMDVEKRRAEIDEGGASADNHWGSFTDSGEMAAGMVNNPYQIHYDGHIVKMGGIGGVASLPEYRYGGAVRCIFEKLLRAARDEGEVFSMLYPFSHEFYRKFGYELCYSGDVYTFDTALVNNFRHEGWARRVVADQEHPSDVKLLTELYNAFARRYNGSVARDDANTRRVAASDPFKNQSFTYLIGEGDHAFAFLRYNMAKDGDKRVLHITDYAFDSPRAFRAILGFLGRMSADFAKVRVQLPSDIPLLNMVRRPYDVERKGTHSLMARLTNPQQALKLMARPEGTGFTVLVHDDFIPENGGTFRVDDAGATRVAGDADLELSVQTLAQLCLGHMNLEQAGYKPDVIVRANERVLEQAFRTKPIYQSDRY